MLISTPAHLGVPDPHSFSAERIAMVSTQLEARGIQDARVLQAMRTVPRHLFVPESTRQYSYEDTPLPIGYRQTISQPYIVAFMTESAKISPDDRVLEIGTGSGYQAAILGILAKEVHTIEIIEPLEELAKQHLKELEYKNVMVHRVDGYQGWPERAPYDVILVTAAAPEIPAPLLEQLAMNGRLVMPVGSPLSQNLIRVTKLPHGFQEEILTPVRFVPFTREKK